MTKPVNLGVRRTIRWLVAFAILAAIGGGVDGGAADGVHPVHAVGPEAVGRGLVGETGAAVGGDAQAAEGGGVDVAADGVHPAHVVVPESVGRGLVGEAVAQSRRCAGGLHDGRGSDGEEHCHGTPEATRQAPGGSRARCRLVARADGPGAGVHGVGGRSWAGLLA